jgi:isopenicillin N synthase-like dioxygenase
MFEQGNYSIDVSDARTDFNTDCLDGSARNAETAGDVLMDHKEVFHVGAEPPLEHPAYRPENHPVEMFSSNVWPDASNFASTAAAGSTIAPWAAAEAAANGFRRDLEAYYNEVEKLSDELFRLFALSLGLPLSYFGPLTDRGMNSMNCIHYPASCPQSTPSAQLGIGEHTDFECFTLLWQQPDGPSSLEVLLDGSWAPVPPRPDCFVVNIGDMMARWSDDLFRSTVHRARVTPEEPRLSVAFFRACNYDTELRSLLKDRASGRYSPILAGQHLSARILDANPNVAIGEATRN